MPTPLKSTITDLVSSIEPTDDLARDHREQTLSWLAGTDDIFRRVKPRTPSPHLVSYFLLVDRAAESVLLCDHRLSGLWLPTGGHVEPGEHPLTTVHREIVEELGVSARPDPAFGDQPFFVTMTETVGPPEARHVDVSLWFALVGQVGQPLQPDEREFAQVRWWTPADLGGADRAGFEPHLLRALTALGLLLQAGGGIREVGAVSFPDQGPVEGQDLAYYAAGLVAVVDDQRAHADIQGQHLEVQVGDEADAFGPVLAQGFLAPDNAVPAEQPHGHGRGEDDIVRKVRKQRLNIVGVPVLSPLLRKRLRLIHAAHAPTWHAAALVTLSPASPARWVPAGFGAAPAGR
jgi:8-oxo-dGTP diphosphatase